MYVYVFNHTCMYICKYVYQAQPSHFLSLYINHIVHHMVEIPQYSDHILTMLSTYCGNIVHHIVNFRNALNIYNNRMWSHYGGHLNIL